MEKIKLDKNYTLILKNLVIMIHNRGYLKNDLNTYIDMIFKNFDQNTKETFIKENDKYYRIKINIDRKITTIKNDSIDKFMSDKNNLSDHKIIILNKHKSYNKTIDGLLMDYKKTSEVEIFMDHELYIDKSKMLICSDHQLLTDSQKTELLKNNNFSEINLPKIQVDDPMSKYYNAKVGDIFKIYRECSTVGRYFIYRVVIPNIPF
jgi:DNA-directed RNA polymerase subunit H (RpoH/RPB5)